MKMEIGEDEKYLTVAFAFSCLDSTESSNSLLTHSNRSNSSQWIKVKLVINYFKVCKSREVMQLLEGHEEGSILSETQQFFIYIPIVIKSITFASADLPIISPNKRNYFN